MKHDEQRIAIAKWMGRHEYVESKTKFNALMRPCCDVCGKMAEYYPDLHTEHAPDYVHDLNAMHKAEAMLNISQQEHFGGFLYHGKVCSFQDFCTGRMVFQFAHATAAQRAEALLRTLGLWTDAATEKCVVCGQPVDGPGDPICSASHYNAPACE